VVAVLAGLAWQIDGPPAARPVRCTVPGTSVDVDPEQAGNARAIAAVAVDRKLPERALTIALATAAQESHLRNLPYGDRDSLGLFQQRPSQGWGTPAQVQDPTYAAGRFFDHLVQVPAWDTGRLTEVAQAVQRSGVPEAYQRWEPTAAALAGALASGRPGPLTCR
jgi:hypothetical protein